MRPLVGLIALVARGRPGPPLGSLAAARAQVLRGEPVCRPCAAGGRTESRASTVPGRSGLQDEAPTSLVGRSGSDPPSFRGVTERYGRYEFALEDVLRD